jgi:hypothetical protein
MLIAHHFHPKRKHGYCVSVAADWSLHFPVKDKTKQHTYIHSNVINIVIIKFLCNRTILNTSSESSNTEKRCPFREWEPVVKAFEAITEREGYGVVELWREEVKEGVIIKKKKRIKCMNAVISESNHQNILAHYESWEVIDLSWNVLDDRFAFVSAYICMHVYYRHS